MVVVRAPDQKPPTLQPLEGALPTDRRPRQSLVSGLGCPSADKRFQRFEFGTSSVPFHLIALSVA